MKIRKPLILVIMDGYGLNPNQEGNAILKAKKPNLDYLFSRYPTTKLKTCGEAVGLPEGQMGNSEVGHLNIGAGRVVYQSFTRVHRAVQEDTLIKMPAIVRALKHVKKNNSALHIMGLLSDGGVHSHYEHIIYLIKKAKAQGVKVYVHAFLDGRDVPPQSAQLYLSKLMGALEPGIELGVVSGRYYAMDRDRNYDRMQLAYDALVYGEAPHFEALDGLKASYDQGITDEFVKPYIVTRGAVIGENDSVIFANFRPDRAIQISLALTNPLKTKLTRFKSFSNLCFVQMMLYSQDVKGLINFDLQTMDNLFGEVVSQAGFKQLRIAETEKYAHVTYFFDGGVDRVLPGADRILIPSPKVATYDLKPEMSAYEVCEQVLLAIKSKKYDVIILNFANCDMVGHTAVFAATVKAVETVVSCVGQIYSAVKTSGLMLITADHGNAELLINSDGSLHSAHTTFDVPFCLTGDYKLRESGVLADLAPTMLELLGIKQPKEMTGRSLIEHE